MQEYREEECETFLIEGNEWNKEETKCEEYLQVTLQEWHNNRMRGDFRKYFQLHTSIVLVFFFLLLSYFFKNSSWKPGRGRRNLIPFLPTYLHIFKVQVVHSEVKFHLVSTWVSDLQSWISNHRTFTA